MSDSANPNPKEECEPIYVDDPNLLKEQIDSNHSIPSIPIEDTASSNKRTADELFGDNEHIHFREIELFSKRQKMEKENDLIEKNLEGISEPAETSRKLERNKFNGEVEDLPQPGSSLELNTGNNTTLSVPLSWQNCQVQWNERPCKKGRTRRQCKQYKKKQYTQYPREKATAAVTMQRDLTTNTLYIKTTPTQTAVKVFAAATTQRDPSSTLTEPVTAQAATANTREPVTSNPAMLATTQRGPAKPTPIQHTRSRRRGKGQYKPSSYYNLTVLEKERPNAGGQTAERVPSKQQRAESPRGKTISGKNDRKRKRPVSIADESQLHLRVAVTTYPQSNFTAEQVELLRKSICNRIIDDALSSVPGESIPPSFRGRPFFMDGVLAMWCEDANALVWLKRTVASMQSPISNTALAVIRQSELLKKLKAGLLLHSSITDSDRIQKILRAQNPCYNVSSWSCYSMAVNNDPRAPSSDKKLVHLVLGIPENQKPAILARDRRICYLTGSNYIRFFSEEAKSAAKTREQCYHWRRQRDPEFVRLGFEQDGA